MARLRSTSLNQLDSSLTRICSEFANDPKNQCRNYLFESHKIQMYRQQQDLYIYIPKYFMNETYHVYGCFCSPECAVAHLMEENIDSSTNCPGVRL